MVMMRNAFAPVVTKFVEREQWQTFRKIQGCKSITNVRTAFANTSVPDVLNLFDPNRYILTHCTIIASVDTEAVPNVDLGEDLWEQGRRITRLWDDFRITKDTEKYINCCAPDTLITMADGRVKVIQDVCVGDYVLTHKGQSRRVLKTYQRDYEGDLVYLKSQGMLHPLRVTPEHPVYVWEASRNCIHCEAPIPTAPVSFDHAVRRFYCSKECFYDRKQTSKELLQEKSFVFKNAGEVSPLWDWTTSVAPKPSEDSKPFSLEVARLIGLFLAEGYYELDSGKDNERVGVMWAFHQKERDTLVRYVENTLKTCFGAPSVVRNTQSQGIYVTSRTNRSLVDFFSTWVKGEGSTSKFFNSDVFNLHESLRLEILRGWLEGDGSLIDTQGTLRMSGTSASLNLINQLYLLALSLDLKPRLQEVLQEGRTNLMGEVVQDCSKSCMSYTLSFSSEQSKKLAQNTYYADKALNAAPNQNLSTRTFVQGCLLHHVSSHRTQYSGKVFNLEVEEDNSYIANGVITHNCNSDAWERELLLKTFWTFIGGYNYQEHIQDPELSKGILLDAVSRDLGDTVYVDLLVATDRVHTHLVRDIVHGVMKTMSMGCSIQFSLCTKCGNVATDEDHMCTHIKMMKGDTFVDAEGNTRKIAELCGHKEIPDSVTFFEGSWVGIPAFEGAHVRNVLYVPPDLDLDASIYKSMSISSSQAPTLAKTSSPSWLDSFRQDAVVLSSSFGNRAAFNFGGDDDADEEGKPKEEKTYMDEVLDESKKLIKDRLKGDIKRELVDDLNKKEDDAKKKQDPMNEAENANDNIIHASLTPDKIVAAVKSMKIVGTTRAQVLHSALRFTQNTEGLKVSNKSDLRANVYGLMALDHASGMRVSSKYYALLLKSEARGSFAKFAKICEIHLKRSLTSSERMFLQKRAQMLREI